MAVKDLWFIDGLSIFEFKNGAYNYLGNHVGIEDTNIIDNIARIVLSSPLPDGFKLLDISKHSTIAIQYTGFGEQDKYVVDFHHIFIEKIEILKKWISIKDGYILAHLTASGLIKW